MVYLTVHPDVVYNVLASKPGRSERRNTLTPIHNICEMLFQSGNVESTPLQMFNDSAPACPPNEWHGPIKKQVTAAGFQLKGDGWYQTDFQRSD